MRTERGLGGKMFKWSGLEDILALVSRLWAKN